MYLGYENIITYFPIINKGILWKNFFGKITIYSTPLFKIIINIHKHIFFDKTMLTEFWFYVKISKVKFKEEIQCHSKIKCSQIQHLKLMVLLFLQFPSVVYSICILFFERRFPRRYFFANFCSFLLNCLK